MQPIRVSIVETEQPIRSREILKFRAQSMRELSLVGIQQEYLAERIKKKIRSVHGGIKIKGIERTLIPDVVILYYFKLSILLDLIVKVWFTSSDCRDIETRKLELEASVKYLL